jgi:hypothetical protein
VFGTLVRLFPIFDFENNDAKQVIIVDIDLNGDDLLKLSKLINYQTKMSEIIGMGTAELLLVKKKRPHFFCGLIAFLNIKFDKKLITNFIKNAHTIIDTGFYEKRIVPFGFGVDELFINKYLIFNKENLNMKTTKLAIILQYHINWFIYYHKALLATKTKKSYNYLKYILGKYYKETYTLDNLFDTLDKLVMGESKPNKYNKHKNIDYKGRQYVSVRFYNLLKYQANHKQYWIPEDITLFINKYMKNIVWSISSVYFDLETLKTYFVKHINLLCYFPPDQLFCLYFLK